MVLAALAATMGTGGCDWVADGADALDQRFPVVDVPPVITNRCEGGPDLNDLGTAGCAGTNLLAGSWHVEVVQYGTFAPIGTDLPLTITDHFLVHVGDRHARMRWTFCDEVQDVESSDLQFVTVVPDAIKDEPSIGPPLVDLGCDGMPAQQVVWTWGLADPAQDPLPSVEDTTGECDQDGDDHPGVTLQVEQPVSGERYLARRVTWDLSAATEAAGEWSGTLTFAVEEQSLGANPSVVGTVVQVHPAAGQTSTYRFRPTTAADCAALMATID
jgi:hypothetical protein